jgi:hypothetical protein
VRRFAWLSGLFSALSFHYVLHNDAFAAGLFTAAAIISAWASIYLGVEREKQIIREIENAKTEGNPGVTQEG